MKPLLITALATLLTACNTSTNIALDYRYSEPSFEELDRENNPTVDQVELCSSLGGELELVIKDNVARWECTFYNPCEGLDCSGDNQCPMACK